MCVFCFTTNKNATFLRKNADTFIGKETFRNKIREIVEDFDEKSYNNNGKTLEILEDFACEAKFLHFSSCFIIFLHFSIFSNFHVFLQFFHFFNFFHFIIFSFSSFFLFFSFFHFFFISLLFSSLSGLLEIRFVFGLICSKISCNNSEKLSRLGVYLFGPSFPFFSLLFFLFFFFLKKKVSSFLFSCISFKYVLLLALVSV